MANEVKVSFVGDTSDLSKKLDQLEKDVEATSKEIDKAARTSTSMSHGFEGVRDSADGTERRIVGFRDSLTGTQDVMKGLKDGDMVALSTGFADLASSVANLGADMLDWGKKAFEAAKNVVEAHAASVAAKAKDIAITVAHKAASIASTVATQAQAAAQWALNAAMSANPIVLVVAALAALTAGIILAYQHSETFRDIIDAIGRFFRDRFLPPLEDAWHLLQTVFGWVKDHWPLLLGILTGPIGLAVIEIVKHWDTIKNGFTGIYDAIVGVGEKIFNAIKEPFDRAFTAVKTIYDHSIGPIVEALSKVKGLGGGFDRKGAYADAVAEMRAKGATDTQIKDILGDNIGPIGSFDSGGVVPGRRGAAQLAVVHGGETILPTHKTGSGGGAIIVMDGEVVGRLITERLRRQQWRSR